MGDLFQRGQQGMKALTLKQIWVASVVGGGVIGLMQFYWTRSFLHTFLTMAFFVVFNLFLWHWSRRA